MSQSILATFAPDTKCPFCDKPLSDGPIILMLGTDMTTAEQDDTETEMYKKGDKLVDLDWHTQHLAHIDCAYTAVGHALSEAIK